MSVWLWTCPAQGTGSVLTQWAPTAVSVTRAGLGVTATWTSPSVVFSSPVNTTPPVLRCRAATGVNAYLDSRGSTAKEVRLFLYIFKVQCQSTKYSYMILILFYDVKLIIWYKVLHFIEDECTLGISQYLQLLN